MAASMLRNAKVHILNTNELDYLDRGQLVRHKLMPHEEFYNLLGSMKINLHVTFSEGMEDKYGRNIAQGSLHFC